MESCVYQNQHSSVEDVKIEEEDGPQPVEIKEELPPEWDTHLDQKDPELLTIKEDEEKGRISQEEEKENADQNRLFFSVKSEEDEEKVQFQPIKSEDISEIERPSSDLVIRTKTEPEEDCGVPEPVTNPTGCSESGTYEKASVVRDEDFTDSGSGNVAGGNGVRRPRAPRSGLTVKTAKLSCLVCDDQFGSRRTLHTHMMSHMGKRASSCSEEPERARGRRKGPKRARCDECGKTLACQEALRYHMEAHGERSDLEAALRPHMAAHARENCDPFSASAFSSVLESLSLAAFSQPGPHAQQPDQSHSGRTLLSGGEAPRWVDYLRTFVLLIQMFVVMQQSTVQQLLVMRRRRRRRRMAILRAMLKRRVWAYRRAQRWWDDVVPHFNNDTFIRNFRVSWGSFTYICSRLNAALERKLTNFRLSIPVHKRIAIALWRLATNNDYQSVSRLFGVGVSTACNCVQDFCHAVINVLLPEHIPTPDAAKLKEMAAAFEQRWRVPQCVGAIDSSHVPILAPEEFPRDFYNRNGWHSIILQAVVDAKGRFWDVSVGHPGSADDADVLTQSHFFMETLKHGQFFSQHKDSVAGRQIGHYIIGDAAYPLQPWLMKPFSDEDRLTQEQQNYNSRLNRAWAVVETTFRRLKGRWTCLSKRNDCQLELTKKMALACCVLHNICEEYEDEYVEDPPVVEKEQPPVHVFQEHEQEAADVRAALVDYFSSA